MKVLEFIKKGNVAEFYPLLTATVKSGVEEARKEYNNDRKIRESQVGKRPERKTKDEVVKDNRIAIPLQRKIVNSAVSFLFGTSVMLIERILKDSEKNDSFQIIKDLWEDVRMDNLLYGFCSLIKSQKESALVQYLEKNEEDGTVKPKWRLLKGKLYPVFDAFGDMKAFGWEYGATEGGQEVSYLYVWTDEKQNVYKKGNSDWTIEADKSKPNLLKKIPIVYHCQDNTEWWEVQELIDRFENSFSKFCDVNDYFASPMYKAKGAVGKLPKKDTTGKLVKLDIIETDKGNVIEADLDVISWDRAPEAVKLELETSLELIYNLSSTANLSMEAVKGVGNIANYAMELMFLNSILKAKADEPYYQIVISRVINLMKAALLTVEPKNKEKLNELRIDVIFGNVLPKNIKEIVETLSEATGGRPIMSQETAVANNPLVEDNEVEISKIQTEASKDALEDLGGTVGA